MVQHRVDQALVRVVIAGVSGSGKSTIARKIADALDAVFVDGDDLHPPSNVAKMTAGIPLDDTDRGPWLAAIAELLSHSERVVVACSALRRRYRSVLREAGDVLIVMLDVSEDLVIERILARTGHFMDASMVASQFAALERPGAVEPATVVVDASRSVEAVVAEVLAAMHPNG